MLNQAAKATTKKPAPPVNVAAKPPEPTRGEKACMFIEKYCRVPEGMHVGKPLVLDDFQRAFLIDIYDNPVPTQMGILSTARKNAKTALIACIVLIHLVGPEAARNSEIISGAMSRDQAAKVYNYASKIVDLSPKLREIVRPIPSQKSLIGIPMNVTYRAVSADAATNMGGSPVLAVLDELGQIKGPNSPFVDAIVTSQGAHENALLLAISTQAETDADLFSTWIDDAKKSKDPHTILHIYEAKRECKLLDEAQWKASNPALGTFRSYSDMQKLARRASRMPSFENAFRNLYLNQRVASLAPFVDVGSWDRCGRKTVPIEECDTIYGALDLSSHKDLTALILLGRKGSKFYVYCYFWTPEDGLDERARVDRVPYDLWVKQGFLRTTPGKTVDYDIVAEEMKEIIDDLDISAIAFDRWRIGFFRKACMKAGIELNEAEEPEHGSGLLLIECGQGYKDMGVAVDELESMILNGQLRHGRNPVLTMCASNTKVSKDPAGNRKFDKQKSTGRIDGMVALVMGAWLYAKEDEDDNGFDDYLKNRVVVG